MNAETYEGMLAAAAEADERIVVMTAENRAAIRNLPAALGDRFIDVGICEQTMVGAAAGLALRGRIPVVHALATFLTMRAFEFIRDDVGIPRLPVKLIGAVPGFLSDGNGPTHQALEDIALMRGIPGMNIFCPADREELLQGMPLILRDRSPWYVRYNALPPERAHATPFHPGRAEVVGRGTDVAILTYGFLVREAVRAMPLLAARGYSSRLVNLRTLQPVDEDAIVEALRDAELVVTLEDHFRSGGLASIVAECMMRRRLMTNVLPLHLEQQWFHPALLDRAVMAAGMHAEGIVEKIVNVL